MLEFNMKTNRQNTIIKRCYKQSGFHKDYKVQYPIWFWYIDAAIVRACFSDSLNTESKVITSQLLCIDFNVVKNI